MSNPFDPGSLHPGHHSSRFKGFDYSKPGLYFVTICTHERKCILASVQNSAVFLTPLGFIVRECWVQIPTHFPWLTLLDFVVMPNHVHGIIEIGSQPGRSSAAPLHGAATHTGMGPGSLGAVVRSFKAIVTKRAHLELELPGRIWQRNYYETILRPGQELANAGAYIKENPAKWDWDKDNPVQPDP